MCSRLAGRHSRPLAAGVLGARACTLTPPGVGQGPVAASGAGGFRLRIGVWPPAY